MEKYKLTIKTSIEVDQGSAPTLLFVLFILLITSQKTYLTWTSLYVDDIVLAAEKAPKLQEILNKCSLKVSRTKEEKGSVCWTMNNIRIHTKILYQRDEWD